MLDLSPAGTGRMERSEAQPWRRRNGLSARRHYDAIGLLAPSRVTPAGYRLYDAATMRRLTQILFFRDLGFPLSQIRAIMAHPDYDARAAMHRQRTLLAAQRACIDARIARLDEALHGVAEQETFDGKEIERMKEMNEMKAQYAQEARERWGHTDAYAQSEARAKAYGPGDWAEIQAGMEARMAAFAGVRMLDARDARVQALVSDWQQYITDHFYACTDEILEGLGQMYEADERFKANIDRYGEGTAACMAAAIAAYCAAHKKVE